MIGHLYCTIRKLMFPLTLAGTLALSVTPVHAEIYKWVDSSGQVQYTQQPPPEGVEAMPIKTAPAPAEGIEGAEDGLQERIQASEEQQQKNNEAAADAEKQAEIERIKRQNCVTARNNLEQLSRSGQIRYRTGEGEVLRLSEEDRQQRIEEARSQIKEFCQD